MLALDPTPRGAFLRQKHRTERLRGAGVSRLSYWTDNRAGYSYWCWGTGAVVLRTVVL